MNLEFLFKQLQLSLLYPNISGCRQKFVYWICHPQLGTHKNSTGRLQNLQTEVLSTYQNLDSYIVDFLHNFTVKFGVFCPISENMKSQGQVLNCHNSKLRCHTNLLDTLVSGAKVSLHFDCHYGNDDHVLGFNQWLCLPKAELNTKNESKLPQQDMLPWK